MSLWQAKALQAFPELRPAIERADSLGALWIEIFLRFTAQYDCSQTESTDPSTLVRRTYMYAIWCASAKDWHTRAAVAMGFFEDLASFAFRSSKVVYDHIIEDLAANLGIPMIKQHSGDLGHFLTKDQLQKFSQDVEEAARRRQRRSAKYKRH